MYVRMLEGPCTAGFSLPAFCTGATVGPPASAAARAPQPASPLPAFLPELWTGDCRHSDGMGAEKKCSSGRGRGERARALDGRRGQYMGDGRVA
jgi:hypothetical protein